MLYFKTDLYDTLYSGLIVYYYTIVYIIDIA